MDGKSRLDEGGLHYEEHPSLSSVVAERRFLRNYTFCILGSVHDAERVVRDTYVRWYLLSEGERERETPDTWLLLVASRLCLERLPR